MSQSLTMIYLHIVFHLKTTSCKIKAEDIESLHRYIGKMVNVAGCQVVQVGGTEDHVHALITLSKTEAVAHVVEDMKRNSSRWIKTLSPYYHNFAWQGGYGAFSIGQSQTDIVIHYIQNQAEHHKKQSFHDEYMRLLQLYNIEYDEKYLWTD